MAWVADWWCYLLCRRPLRAGHFQLDRGDEQQGTHPTLVACARPAITVALGLWCRYGWMAWYQGTEPHINFQGFMVGNAWTDAEIDNTGAVFDWWSHSLISEDTYVVPLCACTPRHVGAQVHVCGTPRGPQVQRRAEQLQHVRHRAPCDEHALRTRRVVPPAVW